MRKENSNSEDRVLDSLIAAALKQKESVSEAEIERFVNQKEKLQPSDEKAIRNVKDKVIKFIRGEECDTGEENPAEDLEKADYAGLSFALGRKGNDDIDQKVKDEIDKKRKQLFKKLKKKDNGEH